MSKDETLPTSAAEWAKMWPLPFAAMLGIAGCAAFAFSSGVFLGQMTRSFGWTRAQFSSGFTLQMLVGVMLAPGVGTLVERFGSRRVALLGIVPFALGLAMLSLANGSIWQWRLLCMAQAATIAFVSPPVWLSPVAGKFQASRGLALGIALAGIGVASMSWPVVTAHYITRLGWRDAFVAMALTYIVVTVPTTYFLFLDSQEPPRRAAAPVPRMQALRSRAFWYVMLAGGLFGSVTLGLGFHMVPLMRANGFDLTTAAGIAGAAGFATLVGRIGTGLLLDRLPVRQVGIAVFLLPALVSLLLLQGRVSLPIAFIAAILFGLASGAETDIVTYMISRHFAPIFATAYAIANQFFAVCASLGPLLAGALFDFSGSYNLYLTLILPTVTVAAILIWRVPPMGDKLFRGRANH